MKTGQCKQCSVQICLLSILLLLCYIKKNVLELILILNQYYYTATYHKNIFLFNVEETENLKDFS